ncbi:putative bifunctional diguanylate cyclase/phosphodiesterase [Actinoplanes solisilvae]|uniref:putative bifunctional diguanylate cyclase/phosphodiesterase n=1 Tax=Actinoplanes solisilvae TaxID=2486853 RepID=UPI000FD9460B|nr:GGDEF domain-containing phosphodiesterase [Actinoplanes solisilvae]
MTGLAALTDDWLRGVAAAGFVPGVRARARAALHDLLEEFVAAVRAEPFDPAPGTRIGAELVDLRMSAPPVIGTTVHLFAGRLPALLGDDSRGRILELLDRLVTGFVAAQRDAAVRAAEEMNRSEKIHWRAVQLDLQRQLQQAVLHRPDTGLPNEQHLRKTLADLGEGRLGLMLLRVDRYDELTEALGHDRGARLLTAVARRLRPLGLLAHLADDLFAVLVTGTSGPDDVLKVADQATRVLAPPFPIDGHRLHVTATAGLVERPAAGVDPGSWLHDARLALGWAPESFTLSGPARPEGFAVFDPDRAEAERRRHRLAADMPSALERGEFLLHYQPLVRLADRAVIGVEALARWRRPGDAGLLGPGHFIQLAERTGLIRPLGRRLLEDACRWGAARPDLLISVNLSPVQLREAGLVGDVADILHRTGLPAARLQLEITETAESLRYRSELAALGALGVRLALDDFGTGYSSLAVLTALPFTEAKLAAEFLLGAGRRGVLRHIIDACHALGMTVTAEGIETAEQESILRDLGCDHGQGFHLGRPTPYS